MRRTRRVFSSERSTLKRAPARVERLEDAPHVAVRDPEEERRTMRRPAVEVRPEVDVHEVAEAAGPVEVDAELTADAARGAVGGEDPLALDAVGPPARPLANRHDAVVVAL